MKALEHESSSGKEVAIQAIHKELTSHLNHLPGIPIISSLRPPMLLAEARELLAKEVLKRLSPEEMARPVDYWLMWTVHKEYKDKMQALGGAPSIYEMKRASVTFNKYYNDKEILKTDVYVDSIEKMLSSSTGQLNLLKDLS